MATYTYWVDGSNGRTLRNAIKAARKVWARAALRARPDTSGDYRDGMGWQQRLVRKLVSEGAFTVARLELDDASYMRRLATLHGFRLP